MKRSSFSTPLRPALGLLRLVVALAFLLPLLWMLAASLYPPGVPLPATLRLLPQEPTLRNFARAHELLPLGRYSANSLLVVTLAVPLSLITASWAGLGMALLPRPRQRRWVIISLAVLMVPGVALWSTRFLIYRFLGWYGTVWALIAPAWMGSSPFFVLMFYRAFRRIPAAVYEAAILDGAGVLQLWARVAMPLARATTLAVALLTFALYWGDFISPLLYLNDDRSFTLPVALKLAEQMTRADWSLLMAVAVWAALPPVAFFLLLQPYFARRQPR
ncbi:MAG: carbohydrate ABC transporter permease [Candidatus Promineifilaceae bacterium]|nr:carbohydrate ABC transporter permease [Candidatus Promineifilaceae bacterium]